MDPTMMRREPFADAMAQPANSVFYLVSRDRGIDVLASTLIASRLVFSFVVDDEERAKHVLARLGAPDAKPSARRLASGDVLRVAAGLLSTNPNAYGRLVDALGLHEAARDAALRAEAKAIELARLLLGRAQMLATPQRYQMLLRSPLAKRSMRRLTGDRSHALSFFAIEEALVMRSEPPFGLSDIAEMIFCSCGPLPRIEQWIEIRTPPITVACARLLRAGRDEAPVDQLLDEAARLVDHRGGR